MDKTVEGVTVLETGSTPYMKIASTAPDKETFTLTFNGTYVPAVGDTLKASFV